MGKQKELFILVIILLFAGGLFFRDTKPVFAAFSLSFMLLADLYMLNKNIDKTRKSFTYSRNADKKIITRGFSTGINAEYNIDLPKKIQVRVEDLIPKGSLIEKGDNSGALLNEPGKFSINYDLTCQAHGLNRFEGVAIRFTDTFYSKQLILNRDKFRIPGITVYPRPSFIKSQMPSFSGKNTDKNTSFISRNDVKGHRNYNISDDIRTIDWKVSAKYDKLIVKEYSGIINDKQLIFVDLPDNKDPYATEKTEIIKGLIGSILLDEKKMKNVEIVLISGPNLKDIITSKNIKFDFIKIMHNISPANQDKYLYKYSPNGYITNNEKNNALNKSLAEKAGFFYNIRSPHFFEKQVYGILKDLDHDETLFIITFPGDDKSHLKIISELAVMKKIRTCCILPRINNLNATKNFRSSYKFDEVKII